MFYFVGFGVKQDFNRARDVIYHALPLPEFKIVHAAMHCAGMFKKQASFEDIKAVAKMTSAALCIETTVVLDDGDIDPCSKVHSSYHVVNSLFQYDIFKALASKFRVGSALPMLAMAEGYKHFLHLFNKYYVSAITNRGSGEFNSYILLRFDPSTLKGGCPEVLEYHLNTLKELYGESEAVRLMEFHQNYLEPISEELQKAISQFCEKDPPFKTESKYSLAANKYIRELNTALYTLQQGLESKAFGFAVTESMEYYFAEHKNSKWLNNALFPSDLKKVSFKDSKVCEVAK